MKISRLLIISFVLLFLLPVAGGFIKWGGFTENYVMAPGQTIKGFPPGYGEFPAQKVREDPQFNETFFIVCCFLGLFTIAFLLFPTLFGFRKPQKQPSANKMQAAGYPSWFRPALVVTALSWLFMWGRFDALEPLDHFMFVPLWWGFIFLLDGIVYKRNGGVSLISSMPNTMKIMAVVSAFSWFVFEFLNFYVLENWYYPNNKVLTNFGNISWQLLSYTTVLPAIFEWYWLLRTFSSLREKYRYGPRINFSTPVLHIFLVAGLSISFFMAIFPDQMFFALWLGLIPALVPAMTLSKIWNPFTAIGTRGDWSPVILIALATLLNGFCWEFWNFGSEWFHDDRPTNPNYWRYSVPYLDKIHIFSEMPLLGYFGYLFFGIGCWILWVTIGHFTGYNATVHEEDKTGEPLEKKQVGKVVLIEKPLQTHPHHEA